MRPPIMLIAILFLSLACTTTVTIAQEKATLILVGGNVVTVDEAKPKGQAIAVAGDRILAVGTDEEIRKLADNKTQIIELNGRLVIPGFIEGHAHFLGMGQMKMMLDLTTAESWDDIVEQVAAAAKDAKPGEWIVGRGWHQEKWSAKPEKTVEGYPSHEKVSAVSPNNPVLLTHASGHMCFANDFAMEISSVNRDSNPPAGGEILHDESGEPTGIFRETAQSLIVRSKATADAKKTPVEKIDASNQAVELAVQECLENGVTSFQDAGSSFATIKFLRKQADAGKLGVRLWVMVRDHLSLMDGNLPKAKVSRHADNFFTVGGIKLSLDGALGAHGAWLLMPYEDLPTSEGLNTAPVETAEALAEMAIKHHYQYCVHAIGDKANRKTLDIFEAAFNKSPSIMPRRWRIEHAQHLHPDDIKRFAELGVVASMQGIHCTSDAIFVLRRLGARRAEEGAYVWQKLLKSGAVVTNGSDAPVEKIDPIASFYATTTRKLKDGAEFFPSQKMSREEALKSYTMACAYAAFEDDIKGSLTAGKLADIVILSKNIMTCPDDEIRDAKVDITIVGGKVAFERAK